MKRVIPWVLGVVVLTAVVAIGLAQAGGNKTETAAEQPPFDLAQAKQELAGAPKPLAKLHAQSSQILEGGVPAFERRMAELKGHPVVINKWASWCGPCRTEFPIFQHAASKYGKQVAFLGVNANDHDTAARNFLKGEALPYPSYSDRNLAISGKLGIVPIFPTTVFLDRNGKRQYIHQGYYTSTDALARDIRRYALGSSTQ